MNQNIIAFHTGSIFSVCCNILYPASSLIIQPRSQNLFPGLEVGKGSGNEVAYYTDFCLCISPADILTFSLTFAQPFAGLFTFYPEA